MGLTNSTVAANLATQGNERKNTQNGNGVVYSVILDENHPRIKNSDAQKTTELIGAIEFRYTGVTPDSDKDLPIAYPSEKYFKSLPVRNETVEILQTGTGIPLYKRISEEVTPNISADPEYIKKKYKPAENANPSGKTESYREIENTSQPKNNQQNSSKYDGFGDYFQTQAGIHKLKLYEGDSLFESRFGQSIRFSAYNNDKNEFSPTTIIRNGENANSRKNKIEQTTLEDLNRDGSIIAMTSEQFELPFTPGTLSDKGSTDFETKPASFSDYPTKLIGDQILINSGRIILSSKNAEMMFFSKKNYGFISDGGLSIDNKLGMDVTVGDNINFVTNDRDVVFYTGKGSIFLGNDQLEPLVKGTQLVNILSELIDAITQQIFLTPSGPTAEGPTNISQFGNIKSKLNDILSKLNQTA